jgi:hypothetical protein
MRVSELIKSLEHAKVLWDSDPEVYVSTSTRESFASDEVSFDRCFSAVVDCSAASEFEFVLFSTELL